MREQPRLTDMIKNTMFDGFLLVRAAQQRTSSNGGKYLDMTLTDISGDVNAKMWDGTAVPAQDRSGTDAEMRVSRQDPKNAKGRLRR